MQHKDEMQQFAAAAEVQRQQRIGDNDDNAEHYVVALRVEQATKLVPKGMRVTLTLLSVLLNV